MIYSTLTEQILLGEGYRNGSHSTQHEHLVVMFEDDGETGYFYAMDLHQTDNPIVDSLFVYNIADIEPNSLKEPRRLEICWSEDGYQAFLLLNGYPHAVFDYRQFVGYNHTKHPLPELGSMWVRKETTPELVEKWLK